MGSPAHPSTPGIPGTLLALPEITAHQVQGLSYALSTCIIPLLVVLFGDDPVISEEDDAIVVEPPWAC